MILKAKRDTKIKHFDSRYIGRTDYPDKRINNGEGIELNLDDFEVVDGCDCVKYCHSSTRLRKTWYTCKHGTREMKLANPKPDTPKPEEEWKDVFGYEGYYQVSNMGGVRSIDREVNGKNLKGRILKPGWTGAEGVEYKAVCLHKDGNRKNATVHRLVGENWLNQPRVGLQINHINYDRADNRVENLEWVTAKENTRHSYAGNRYENRAVGERCHDSLLTEDEVLEIMERLDACEPRNSIASDFGVRREVIARIDRGETWNYLRN